LQFPGLTVEGDVYTGLRVEGATYDDFGEGGVFNRVAGDEFGPTNPQVYAYSDSIDDGTSFRAQLWLVWQRDNLGVKTRFRYKPSNGDLGGTLRDLNNTVNKAFVWGTILDGKAKVSAGKGLDDSWGLFYSSFGSGNTTSFAGKDGVMLNVMPIDGLNLGAFYGSANLFANANNDDTSYDILNGDRRLVVGAKYVADPISVVASLYHNFTDSEDYGTYFHSDQMANIDAALPNTSNLLVGFRFKQGAIQADLSMAFVNLGSMTWKKLYNNDEDMPGKYKKGDYNPFWIFAPKLNVSFGVNDQLSVALGISDLRLADMYYYADADADNAEDKGKGNLFPITITPSVAYAVDENITAGFDLSFKMNTDGSDQFGLGVKPSAEFSLGNDATFVVYDELTFWAKSNDEVDFMKKHPGAMSGYQGGHHGASGTTNTLQFDFVWKF
jgi:hypothetical protein